MSRPGGAEPLEISTPFDGKPHRVSMGLRPLDLPSWLDPDDRRPQELAEKARLLGERPDEVFVALPGSERAGVEVLALVLDRLGAMSPSPISATSTGWQDDASGLRVETAGLQPLDIAGRLVQEDLCIMERDASGQWLLTAASLCFPSRWLLADKIGRSLSQIHDPVPDYERIERATDLAFDRMRLDRPVARSNWTLLDDSALFQPRPEARGKAGAAGAGEGRAGDLLERIYLRVERQTLRLLPSTGAVLFTIRTRVDALALLAPAQRDQLAATLRTVDEATAAYKGWQNMLPALLDRLQPSA